MTWDERLIWSSVRWENLKRDQRVRELPRVVGTRRADIGGDLCLKSPLKGPVFGCSGLERPAPLPVTPAQISEEISEYKLVSVWIFELIGWTWRWTAASARLEVLLPDRFILQVRFHNRNISTHSQRAKRSTTSYLRKLHLEGVDVNMLSTLKIPEIHLKMKKMHFLSTNLYLPICDCCCWRWWKVAAEAKVDDVESECSFKLCHLRGCTNY